MKLDNLIRDSIDNLLSFQSLKIDPREVDAMVLRTFRYPNYEDYVKLGIINYHLGRLALSSFCFLEGMRHDNEGHNLLSKRYGDIVAYHLIVIMQSYSIPIPAMFRKYLSRLDDMVKKSGLSVLSDIVVENEWDIFETFSNKSRFEHAFHSQQDDVSIYYHTVDQVMVSMTILRFGSDYVIIDCGSYVDSLGNEKKLDHLDEVINTVVGLESRCLGVIVTHAHMDHYGSLSELYKLFGDSIPVMMTDITYQLIRRVNGGFAYGFLDKLVRIIQINERHRLTDDIELELFEAGHIPGSVGVLIEAKGKRYFHSGDFSMSPQTYSSPNRFEQVGRVDVLITETTYGSTSAEFVPIELKRHIMIEISRLFNDQDWKVLYPVFAIGRAQEVMNTLTQDQSLFKEVFVGGMVKDIANYFCNKLNYELDVGFFRYMDEYDGFDFDSGNLYLASSGMLQNGTTSSYILNKLKGSSSPFVLIKTGYITSGMLRGIEGVPIIDMSMSAHASRNQILRLINSLAPSVVVEIHGVGLE